MYNASLIFSPHLQFHQSIDPISERRRDGGFGRVFKVGDQPIDAPVQGFYNVVRPDNGATWIAYAKANPGKINMASGGVGSAQHVYGELFKMMTGVDMLHVPYRGGGPALTDLLAGQVQVMFDTMATSIEHIRAGKLRPLAVTGATRAEVLPNVPPVGDFVPGYEGTGWQGVGAPRNTPTEIIDKLNKEINAGLADPRMKARIADLGGTVFASSPAEFATFIAEYTEKWAKVIKFAGAKIN